MAFKNQWVDKIDGVDTQSADDVNLLASGIIQNETDIAALQEKNNELDSKIETVNTDLFTLSERVGTNEERISTAETDITNLQGSVETAQSTAESANQNAVTVIRQLDDMNVAIQGHTNDILNTNITVSQLTERVAQNETDIKELQDNGGSGEAEIIYVNITQSADGMLTSDKTYSEIYSAYLSGQYVIAVVEGVSIDDAYDLNMIMTLSAVSDDGFLIFSTTYAVGANQIRNASLTMSMDNTLGWSIYGQEVSDVLFVTVNISGSTSTATASFDDIEEAKRLNKFIIAEYKENYYVYDHRDEYELYFSHISGDESSVISCTNENVWTVNEYQLATTDYVDTAIGDVETALDNIITKYGLGGEDE